MEETNREHARRAYDALNRRDLDGFLAEVHEQVEFRSLVAEAEGDVFRGHEGVRRWWKQVAESLGGLEFHFEDMDENGDRFVSQVRVRGNVSGTGVEQTMWQAVEVRDEKAAWWATFRTPAEAWAALRERSGA